VEETLVPPRPPSFPALLTVPLVAEPATVAAVRALLLVCCASRRAEPGSGGDSLRFTLERA